MTEEKENQIFVENGNGIWRRDKNHRIHMVFNQEQVLVFQCLIREELEKQHENS